MEGTGFLKTVNFGGFDKKDVLAYVDELNTKIYTLEAELDEKKALLENSEGGGADNEKYEELLAADKAKITELQTSNDSLKNQMKSLEDELANKEKEIEALKAQNTELEDQLQDAKNKAAAAGSAENSAMELGNVFMEAQKTANIIVTQAKENARKMDEDAKKLANQVVDDANGKASTIVKNADEKATKILSEAEDKSAEMRTTAENIKKAVTEEITEIEAQISDIKDVLKLFSSDSLARLDNAKEIIDKTQAALKKGVAPAPAAAKTAPAPAPAPAPTAAAKPAAEPAPAAHEAKKPSFGFDMSELESLTKAAEAAAEVDPKTIGLSDM